VQTDWTDANDLANYYRALAVKAVSTCITSVIEGLVAPLDFINEPDEAPARIRARSGHRGEPTRPLDERAASTLSQFLVEAKRGHRILHEYVEIGEEQHRPFDPQTPDLLLIRSDVLDGTTNAVTLLDSWATAVLLDLARRRAPGHFRHLAGAIGTSAGWVVSWTNVSTRAGVGRYRDVRGSVYIENVLHHYLSSSSAVRRFQLGSLTAGNPNRIAAVAAPSGRRGKLSDKFGEVIHESWFWSGAGNPLAPALLAGELGAVIEPEFVTLHDSAYLIPFTILGGEVADWSGLRIQVLDHYEEYAVDPGAPMPPFVALKSLDTAQRLGLVLHD